MKVEGIALQIDASDVPFTQAFNVEGINQQYMQGIQNEYVQNCLICASGGRDLDECPLASMSCKDGNYRLEVSAVEYIAGSGKIKLTKDNMRKIFCNILSHGVIPRDSNNGYKIKLR